MRRVFLLLLLSALLVAGCGSSSTGSPNAANTELSYFPANSPFVMSIATDPNSSAIQGLHALIGRYPEAEFGLTALMGRLDQLGIDYQNDIRPLFGNPVMLSANPMTRTGASSATSSALVVWVTKDAGKLDALLKKIPGVKQVGSRDGATVYQEGHNVLAVDGATIVGGPSIDVVNAALDRHAHRGGLTSGDYTRAFSGLPQNGLVQVFGNLASVLAQPSAATARLIPWVAALRSYAVTMSASSNGLNLQYRLDTTGRSLTSSQLPLATSTGAPSFAGNLPITVGIVDPRQIFAFAESAAQSTSTASYAKFRSRQSVLRARTGTDLNSLIKLMTGKLIIASNLRMTVGRVGVSDARSAEKTLARLVSDPRDIFAKPSSVTRLSGGFYAVHQHRSTFTIGVVGNQLVAGKATPAQLRAFAVAPASSATGAGGGLAFRIALAQLIHLSFAGAPPAIARTVLASLGDITGWSSATPSGVTGSATLALR